MHSRRYLNTRKGFVRFHHKTWGWSIMVKNKTKIGVKWLKHIRGTGSRSCRCGTWIRHYERISGLNRRRCCAYGCSNAATHGAHVRISRGSNNKEWIALTCQECNKPGSVEEFRIVQNTLLVTATKCQCPCRRRRRRT